MNKNFYKTIFSKTRGEMIAVAENTSAQGQNSCASDLSSEIKNQQIETKTRGLGLNFLSFSMLVLTGFASVGMGYAEIVADQNTAANQRPTIMNSANGTPTVNIQTPSNAGVSMNHYQQFDVNQQGAILNNSRQNVQTQLGGYVEGNPWLAGGEAKVIVNQVNSHNPSYLNGYIEVAGRKADVIIANPMGLNIDGAGFINAGGVTLTTGNPMMNQGQLTGFQVRNGVINITGKGLDASSTDYTQILSQAAQINAGIWAKDLSIVAGKNDIDASQQVTSIASGTGSSATFAIDTSSLGGMYAGKISLVSTDERAGIRNAGQIFATAGNIHLSANGDLNNSGAMVAQHDLDTNQATLDIHAKQLKNSGSISSQGQQNIVTNTIENSGLMSTYAELNIQNSGLLHNQGDLNAGRIDIYTQDLNNLDGKINQTGLQDLEISTTTLNNLADGSIGYNTVAAEGGGTGGNGETTGGNTEGGSSGTEAPSTGAGGGSTSVGTAPSVQILAKGQIQAQNIQNSGEITANGGVDLTTQQALDNAGNLNVNTLNSQGSTLKNSNQIIAQTAHLHALNQDNTAGKIYANNLDVQANQLNNTNGVIQSQQQLNANIQNNLNNQAGQILAGQLVNITDAGRNSLTVNNTQGGEILSGGNLTLQAKKLNHTDRSELLAEQNIQLNLDHNFDLEASIQAGKDLQITTTGDLSNRQQVIAGNALIFNAQNIINYETASIQANSITELNATNSLTNFGLINGDITQLKADVIHNNGAKIYGSTVNIQANTLNNTNNGNVGAVIAARDEMNLGLNTLNNTWQGQINDTARDNAWIFSGGTLNLGNTLVDGQVQGSAELINNRSAAIESLGDMQLHAKRIENRNDNFSTQLVLDGTEFYESYEDNRRPGIDVQKDGSFVELKQKNGYLSLVLNDGRELSTYNIFQYDIETWLPEIVSSTPGLIVSGGDLNITADQIINDQSQLMASGLLNVVGGSIENTEHVANKTLKFLNAKKWFYDTGSKNSLPFSPPDETEEYRFQGIYGGQQVVSTPSANVADLDTQGNTDVEIRTVQQESIKIPSNALYSVHPESESGYFIETDPAFANYKNWISSDYFIKGLGIDPASIVKRLGDGFYEQRLIQEQVAQLTGHRYLNSYANDEEQYKALMNSGIQFAQAYNLTPGVALSAEQIALLTSDIVWLEERTITLPDGTTVQALVPQVYVRSNVVDLKADGGLISANQVKLDLKNDLNNTATIAGRDLAYVNANNINQNSGRITADHIGIKTENDLNNIGGTIHANKSAVLDIGGDLNNESTTKYAENKNGKNEFSRLDIDRTAVISVGNLNDPQNSEDTTLSINVGGDATLKAGQILNANGGTVLHADGDIKLDTIETKTVDNSYKNAKNYSKGTVTTDVGSQIVGVGDVVLSGTNIDVIASRVSSQSADVILSAKEDINITTGQQVGDFANADYKEKKGFLKKSSTQRNGEQYMENAISSTVDGNRVILDANNINVHGSQIISDELTQLQAKQDVNITAAENLLVDQNQEVNKKSGFTASLSSGVASIGYGKSNSDVKSNSVEKSLTQSLVSSIDGNTNIIAGGDVNSTASIIEAGGDINLIGNNVNLKAAEVTQDQTTQVKSQQSGFSIGVTYNPLAAAKDAYDKSNQDQFSDSAVGKIMSHAEAVRKASMAAATPIVVGVNSQKVSQKSTSHSTESVVSEVKAGGNLNIIARDGDILSEGAKISAEGDALLHAKNNIELLSVSDTQRQDVDNKRSGFSIDNRDHVAPIGVYNDKALADGDMVTSRGSQVSVGGKATLQTEQGDINVIGSKVVSQDDLVINAAKDVNIKSSQNSQSQSESQSSKGWGSAQISDTERFDGYMASRSDSQSSSVLQERSQVGSLDGNVTVQAGNNYNQQVADVVAGQDINITAKAINILEDHDVGQSSQSSEDLKIGVFSRVSSPLLDLVNAVDQAVNSKANDRTQALQYAAAGAQSYLSYNTLNQVQKDLANLSPDSANVVEGFNNAAFLKAEAGIGFSTSESEQSSSYANSQANLLKAGGNVNLTSTEGNIHLQNTQVKAAENIALDSAKDILLESGQSQQKADGSNSNMGAQVGYGASIGAQTGVYIYAEAGYGKGSNHSASNTHQQTTLESNSLSLKSQGDTTLRGAQATANRIDADVGGKLSIISPQDTSTQEIDQSSVGGRVQVSIGTAWQASGNYNNSQASGNSQGVNQQSGLFAGDGGYHVKADAVDLQGGAIVSTASQENNDLTANSLTFSNIQNKSNYEATTVAVSGGYGSTNLENPDGNRPNYTNNENWRDSNTYTPSLPQQTKDSDSTTTYATLSAGNITIGGKETTVEELGINSDSSKAHQQVNGLPDLQAVLDQQKIVADATSTIAAATATYAQNQQQKAAEAKQAAEAQAIQDLEAKGGADWENYTNGNDAIKQNILKESNEAYRTASDTAQSWGIGGSSSRALTAVTTAITAALGGQTDLQALTNTLSPYAAAFIGEQWGHGEDKNTAAQMVAHAILGATLAYVNGGNSGAGASAAVASEAAAEYFMKPYRDNPLYQDANGVFQPSLLPEDVKAQIRDLTAGIGAVIGGAVGDSSYNAQLAGVIGKNTVENNEFSIISQNIDKIAAGNKKKKQEEAKWLEECKNKSCAIPINKSASDYVLENINNLTVRQLAAVFGADYDPLTGEKITPNERQLAKASMLGLYFSKLLSGPAKLTDDALIAIENKYGKEVANKLFGSNVFSPSSKNPLAKDALPRNTDRLVLSQGSSPTCGHNSCAMVLDTLGKPVNVESLIASIKPSSEGILSQEVSNLLSKNNVENLFLNGRTINDLSRYTDKGTPVIVRITDSKNPQEFSHFVVVDGITERAGQKVVAIRDPHGKSYFSPLETFKKAFTGEAIIPRNFK